MIIDAHINPEARPNVVKKRFEDISRAVNGNIEFGGTQNVTAINPQGAVNIKCSWQSVVTPGADVEFTITHNLGQIPEGFIPVSQDKVASIYASRKASWTATQMFLKCSVATVTLTGFVL